MFTGTLSHKDTLAVLQAADVFVLNSSYEGLSHLLIEAQELGIPTIATDVGGNPEVIKDGQNGLLVRSGDTKALSMAISRVLGDKALRMHFSMHAKQSVHRFSIENMLTEIALLIQEL